MNKKVAPVFRAALVSSLALAFILCGCVSRGDWRPVHAATPDSLTATRSLSTAHVDSAAWPTDTWWHQLGDPQLDTLIDEALAGSPSLEVAQARLREAQAETTRTRSTRWPTAALNAEVTRQRFPENGLYPPPYAGN